MAMAMKRPTPSKSGGAGGSGSPRRAEVVSRQATHVQALSTKLEWSIDDFEKLMKLFKNGQNLVSRQFGAPGAPNVQWELHVYPNGKREEDVNNVSFFLRQIGLQRGEEAIMTEFQIYTYDANGQRVSVCRDTKDFSHQQGRGKFQVTREKMLGALRGDGSLLLICEVEYFPPGFKLSVEQTPDANDPPRAEKVDIDLRELLDGELLTDCCLKIGNRSIKAHRCIMALHSEVFRSMFLQEGMLEAQNGIIDIADSYYEPVRAMLEFMYTGSTADVERYPEDILAIADKYAMHALKEQCERRLARTVAAKNVCDLVIFADTYNALTLKNACIAFMSKHHKELLKGADWKRLKKEHAHLANELLELILSGESSHSSGALADIGSVCEPSSSSPLKYEAAGTLAARPPPRKRARRGRS